MQLPARMLSTIIPLLFALLPLTLAIREPTCDYSLPARTDWLLSCLDDLRAHASDIVELSGPAFTSRDNICFRGDPTGQTATTSVVVMHPVSGTFRTTKGDVACGVQRILDRCGRGDGLVGGTGGVCGTEEFLVGVDGWHNEGTK